MDFNVIASIVADQFDQDVEDLNEDTDLLEDLNCTSMDVVELIVAIESATDVRIPDEAVDSIRTIGDIARCPLELMRAYLGKAGAVLWACANGLENSPVMREDERPPIKSVGHGMTLTADLTTEREVFDTIIELSQEVGTKLRKNGLRASGVCVAIRDNDLAWRELRWKALPRIRRKAL